MTNIKRRGISLIILVITILVLSILAATVIISLNNTNIIQESNKTVEKYNYKTLKEKINLAELQLYADAVSNNEDVKMSVFDKIDAFYENNYIAQEEKEMLLSNGGIIKDNTSNDMISLDTSNVIKVVGHEDGTASGETNSAVRFIMQLVDQDGIEYTEFGHIALPSAMLDVEMTELPHEAKLVYDAKTRFQDTTYLKTIASATAKEFTNVPGGVTWTLRFTGLTPEKYSRVYAVRAYAKYNYTRGGENISGIIYSPIYYGSFDDAAQSGLINRDVIN